MKTLLLLLFASPVFAQTYDYNSVLAKGTITAEITVDNGVLASYNASYASQGLVLALDPTDTTAGNSITLTGNGAVFSVSDSLFHYGNLTLDFGSGTDSVTFTNSGWNPICGGEFGSAVYCLIQDSGKSGAWTQTIAAPEIDPAGGLATFLFLGFGLAVIRGRR